MGVLAAVALLIGLLCCNAFASDEGKLLFTGSSTMTPLMREIAKRFEAIHPNARIEVQAGGSGRGIADVRQGRADIGMASRPLTDAEQDLFGFAIARDGVCIIIHRDNPVKSLASRQVIDIFTGKTTNWKKVGGRDATITVLNATSGYSSAELFTHHFKINHSEIKAHQTVGDNPARIKAVSENPNAIVYVSVGEAERKAQGGAPIRLLPVDGVAATSRNVRSGNFPISRPLLLVTKSLPKGLAKAFIEFSLSPQVADLIMAHDFVPYTD
ncbi:MAG: phosphate ABC transporter substrate-binding protein [Geobacter sp.]|nr:phosphate ABC transporter substrate-binding protein [Geobacter sp.]